ncbi:MAG: ligand-binding protein SH3 [Spirochaetes bacterium]|nr:MAG: ligand-binding protein SH3 [Spirochaetota bacterium]
MNANTLMVSALLSLLPVSELRGAIPYALSRGASLAIVFPFCVLLNIMISPLLFIFLSTLHKLFFRLKPYRVFFEGVIERARKRITGKVEKFGYFGVVFFVAIPLPITGAYTGTLGAWVLGLNPIKTFLAVAGGVVIAGIIVSLVSVLGIEALSFFIRDEVF